MSPLPTHKSYSSVALTYWFKCAMSFRFSQGLPNITCNNVRFKADINYFSFVLRIHDSKPIIPFKVDAELVPPANQTPPSFWLTGHNIPLEPLGAGGLAIAPHKCNTIRVFLQSEQHFELPNKFSHWCAGSNCLVGNVFLHIYIYVYIYIYSHFQ